MDYPNLWYKDAIFYQIHVKTFFDSNGDGIGDFKGLRIKLDYLQSIGINCIWLLPFYSSPLRDDGYDPSDFYDIHPSYGTMQDFEEFLAEAHKKSIRVIIDLVANQVSDQHPWFQESRSSPNSPKRNWFVWSDTERKFEDAPVIFYDIEKSNWSWDPVAKMYYWHRYYSSQPDLNYDNPEVQEEIKNVVKFWLDKRVDGFRCDSVPFLFEREGTKCENLPETHSFFKEIRRMMDQLYPGRILLAEANQPPSELMPYFGTGDEFHLAFNFPFSSKVFVALAMESNQPIIDIISQLTNIPENCSWGVYLRNHDTIQMITEKDREYLLTVYAKNPRSRLNGGIRRRLAPLINNDWKQIELLHAILLSIQGTPILYYGDEIGMGDDIYLPDRDGMRTPMQWNAGENAGFSQADFDYLCLPPIRSPTFHYTTINVHTEEHVYNSLLHFLKQMIKVRKDHMSFGRGSFRILEASNVKILAFIRKYEQETILAVFNLAGTAQAAKIDLKEFKDKRLVEVTGNTLFPDINDLPYVLTLSPHGFYWFLIQEQ